MTPPLRRLLVRVLDRLPRPEQRTARFLTGFAVVFAVLVLGIVLSVPRLLDGTRQGKAIAAQIATATGLRVVIEGRVEVSVLPRPHIGINKFSLVTLDGRTTRLSVPRVDLNVTLGSLLSQDYEVSQISLQQPAFTLDRADLASGQLSSLQLQALSVRRVSVNDGTLTVTGSPATETISGINGQIVLPDSTTLLQAVLAGEWRGAPVNAMVDIAAPLGTDPSLARASLDIGAAETSLKLAGIIDLAKPDWPVQAQLDLQAGQGAALWALASSLGMAPPAPADAALHQPLTLSAVLNGNRSAYNAEGIKLSLGTWPVEGLARVVTGTEGGLSVALKTGPLDLAAWPTLLDWGRRGDLLIPAHWLAAFDVNLASLTFGNRSTGAVHLKGEIKNGAATFSEASAVLPGNSHLSLSGTVTTRPQVATTLDGKISLEALQLRELLTAWQIPLPERLDDSALRQMKLAADLRGTWAGIGISGLDLQLDGTRLTGQISPPAGSQGFVANLAVEQLNLDQYAAAGGLPVWLWDLPATSFSLKLARVQAGDKQAENVNLQGSISQRLLTVKSLEAADFGGNRIRLSGTLSADAGQDADFTMRLIAPDFTALSQSFPPAAQLVPAALTPLLGTNTDLSVRWRRTGGETQQLSSASFTDGRFDVVLTQGRDVPLRWKVRLQNRETATVLARLLPAALARPDAVLGMLDLYAEGEAAQGNSWHVNALQGQVAGFSFKGGDLTVAPGLPVQVSGRIDIGQGSLALLEQTVNPAALLAAATGRLELGAEKINWRGQPMEDVHVAADLAAGGQLTVSEATGRWQEGTFKASGQLGVAGTPSLKGTLELSETSFAWQGGDRLGMNGMLDFSVRVDSTGQDWATLLRNMNGDGEFTLDSGTVRGIDLAALSEAMLDRKPPPEVNAILARGGESALSTFGGDFQIEEGVVRAPQLRLRTPAASAEVVADLDLSVPRLDGTAAVTLREVEGSKPFTVRLSGRLDAVVPTFDADALTAQAGTAAAPAAGDKPAADQPAASAMGDTKSQDAAAAEAGSTDNQDVVEVRQPEAPKPPSLDEPVAQPVTTAADEGDKDQPARRPINRASNNSSRPTASRETARDTQPVRAPSAPRRERAETQMAGTAALPAGAPPSIQDLLQAMPGLNEAATAAVKEAAPLMAQPPAAGPGAAALPEISFTPVDDAPPPRAAPVRTPVSASGLAPEFGGERPQGTSDKPDEAAANVPITSPQIDVVDPDEGKPPPASVGELMNRVQD